MVLKPTWMQESNKAHIPQRLVLPEIPAATGDFNWQEEMEVKMSFALPTALVAPPRVCSDEPVAVKSLPFSPP